MWSHKPLDLYPRLKMGIGMICELNKINIDFLHFRITIDSLIDFVHELVISRCQKHTIQLLTELDNQICQVKSGLEIEDPKQGFEDLDESIKTPKDVGNHEDLCPANPSNIQNHS